jgi:hypothetical protein
LVRSIFLGDINRGPEEQAFQFYPLLDDIRSRYRRSGQGEAILPKLESITWDLHTQPSLEFGARLFIGALRKLVIWVGDNFDGEDDLDLIPTYIATAVHLTKFELHLIVTDDSAYSPIQECAADIMATQSSSVVDMKMNQRVFMWLLRNRKDKYPSLQSLEFTSPPDEEENSSFVDPYELPETPFPALRSIKGLVTRNAEFWAPFISYVGASIKQIHVFEFDIMDSRSFLERVGKHCSCLQSLILPPIPPDTPPARETRILQRLLSCSSLASFTLRMESPYSREESRAITFWSDEDIYNIAFAWTNLEVLDIGVDYGFHENRGVLTPILSLRPIATLCTSCPRLQSLSLIVDATNCPSVADISPSQCSFALKSLRVCASPITNPKEVATFLHNICPAAEISSLRNECAIKRMWDSVNVHMRFLQMI